MALEAGWSLVSRKAKMPSYSSTGRDLAGRFRWRPYAMAPVYPPAWSRQAEALLALPEKNVRFNSAAGFAALNR